MTHCFLTQEPYLKTVVGEYDVVERFTIPGDVQVYVLEGGRPAWRCKVWGHKYIQPPVRVTEASQLPRVTWCLRCTWRQIQTDVPEAHGSI